METDKKGVELFEMALYELKNNPTNYPMGICQVFFKARSENVINGSEHILLHQVLQNNKPTADNEYKEFFNNKLFEGNTYWWSVNLINPLSLEQRILFLEALITNLKK